jgi:uncharacterized membrane protein YjjP (DUF1212 family)
LPTLFTNRFHMTQDSDTRAPLRVRIGFVVDLAKRLHEYGTAAPRLEDVINLVSARLGLSCNVLATPTSIVLSFSDPEREDDLAEMTQVVRLPPGSVDLKRLCQIDEIADQVIDGRLELAAGRWRLRQFRESQRTSRRMWVVASFAVSAASIAAILETGWKGILTAGLVGAAIGVIERLSMRHPNIAAASEAISALLATLIATLVAVYVTPITVRPVIIASLIVLMPGMTLTTAVRELSSQHLISGTARMMGAVATLLKLTFGTLAATQICALLGLVPVPVAEEALPVSGQWVAVFTAAFAFAVLFRAPLRFFPVVVASVVLAYACTQLGDAYDAPTFGVFLGSLLIGAASNLFARIANRPGALVREPGIILLVPGSVGFRSLSFVLERDVWLGLDTAITLVTLLVAIVAGLLFGDLLIPPRRRL